jgi:hypothetical protein
MTKVYDPAAAVSFLRVRAKIKDVSFNGSAGRTAKGKKQDLDSPAIRASGDQQQYTSYQVDDQRHEQA